MSGTPSGVCARPSTVKPGPTPVNPRSTRASARRPDQASGSVAVQRSQVVPHGGPQRSPAVNGV
ncbi:hypothetical protein VSR01_02210 [Actinacidiphila sp. DG2A-62]|nr:hypothetical protein [Actinacidiphila sp. DG2A-62]MEC3992421.1 hypothetical protein [Actinacidiphila sp. DG2A-62]